MILSKYIRKCALGFVLLLAFSSYCSDLKAQAPNWDSVYADYFTKYALVDTPSWLFPICFKDGTGARDTIYFGFDSTSTFNLDTNFGELYSTIDTAIFNVDLGGGFFGDSALKLLVYPTMSLGFNITFLNGRMPVTMYWDDSLFYSDGLPFPDLSPLPRARGQLWCDDFDQKYWNCPTGVPIEMTNNPDSILPPFTPFFWARDSIFFNGDTTGPLSYMYISASLNIVPYNKSFVSIKEQGDQGLYLNFYPNPVSNKLNIENIHHRSFTYKVFDYLGRQLISGKETNKLSSLDFEKFPNGIYFIKIELDDRGTIIIEKIIKTK